MKSFLDPHTILFFSMLRRSRESLSTGRISFFGGPVDCEANPLRFWTEWAIQAVLLAVPFVAIATVLVLTLGIRS